MGGIDRDIADTIAGIQKAAGAQREANRARAPIMAAALDVVRSGGFPGAKLVYVNENGFIAGKPAAGAIPWQVTLPVDSKYWKDVAKAEAVARDAKPKRGRATAIRTKRR
jgi:hypothetical protein